MHPFFTFLTQLLAERRDEAGRLHGFDLVLKGGAVLSLRVVQLLLLRRSPDGDLVGALRAGRELLRDVDFELKPAAKTQSAGADRLFSDSVEGRRRIFDDLAKDHREYVRPQGKESMLLVPVDESAVGGIFELHVPPFLEPKSVEKYAVDLSMELPMSSMTLGVSEENVEALWSFIAACVGEEEVGEDGGGEVRALGEKSKVPLDHDFLRKAILSLDVHEVDSSGGLFLVDDDAGVNYGSLSAGLVAAVNAATAEAAERQFLVCHFSVPDRLFMRLRQKNLPKARRISRILDGEVPSWLISEERAAELQALSERFLDHVAAKLSDIFCATTLDEFWDETTILSAHPSSSGTARPAGKSGRQQPSKPRIGDRIEARNSKASRAMRDATSELRTILSSMTLSITELFCGVRLDRLSNMVIVGHTTKDGDGVRTSEDFAWLGKLVSNAPDQLWKISRGQLGVCLRLHQQERHHDIADFDIDSLVIYQSLLRTLLSYGDPFEKAVLQDST